MQCEFEALPYDAGLLREKAEQRKVSVLRMCGDTYAYKTRALANALTHLMYPPVHIYVDLYLNAFVYTYIEHANMHTYIHHSPVHVLIVHCTFKCIHRLKRNSLRMYN